MKINQTQNVTNDSLIPNTQIESMFMRVCSDEQMEKYVSLVDRGHISLATAYASNIVYQMFYQLVELYEKQGGNIEVLGKHVKRRIGRRK